MIEPRESPAASLRVRWLRWSIAALVVLGAWLLLFARTMDRDLNHDEHQFLAPAALLSREGLQPWRDYPLFHLPNLVLAYAAADRLTGNIILGAKLVCFSASAVLILGLVAAAMRIDDTYVAFAVAIAAVLLLLGDPLFRFTAGKTWNHEAPSALLIGAIACLASAGRRDDLRLTAAAGLAGGLAAGCRLTFAPTLVGLFIFVWLIPLPLFRRSQHAFVLTVAATLALTPSLYYLATQPAGFIFGNFQFPRLRLLDATDIRAQETVVWWRKLRFFFKEIVRESLPVFLLAALIGIRPGWRWLRRRAEGDITGAVILVCFPFVLFGCFAPSRYQYQHYFIFIPLLVYALVAGVRARTGRMQTAFSAVALIVGVTMGARSWKDYASLKLLSQPQEWFPMKAAALGARIRELVPKGRVLTLGPSTVLAGKLSIYPELVTGAFGWRAAHHVPPDQRASLHLLAPEDLAELLADDKPAAILTGVEEAEEEEPLIHWAEENRYRPVDLRKKRTVWLPPKE